MGRKRATSLSYKEGIFKSGIIIDDFPSVIRGRIKKQNKIIRKWLKNKENEAFFEHWALCLKANKIFLNRLYVLATPYNQAKKKEQNEKSQGKLGKREMLVRSDAPVAVPGALPLGKSPPSTKSIRMPQKR